MNIRNQGRMSSLVLLLSLSFVIYLGCGYEGAEKIEYDGDSNDRKQFIWVVDNDTDLISKFDLLDGNIVEQFLAPGGAEGSHHGLAWDGHCLWVCDLRDGEGTTFYRINPSDHSVDSSFYIPNVKINGLTWIESSLWGCGRENIPSDYIIAEINVSDGEIIESFTSPVGAPQGIAWDGTDIWVVGNTADDEIFTVDIEDGSSTFQFFSPDVAPCSIAWKDYYLWLWGASGDAFYKIDKITGNTITNINISSISATGITFISD